MTVNSTTGSIFVSKLKPIGAYLIKVVGTLPDLFTKTSAIITININTNIAPVFSSSLTDISV
jgi:hypothetical protein